MNEVDETVARMEQYLEQGIVGFDGLYSTLQHSYRAAWCDVMDRLNDQCNEDFERWQPHRAMMIAALERHGGNIVHERRQVVAVNTTLNGREDEVR